MEDLVVVGNGRCCMRRHRDNRKSAPYTRHGPSVRMTSCP